MRLLKIVALVALYLAAVLAANLIVTHYGPSAVPYVAFGLVGAALIFRDRFADFVNPRSLVGVALQVGLVAAGSLLTYVVNRDAAAIAQASVIAFAASELVEQALYAALARRPWLERAPLSATAAAAVDSVLFITIAFGFAFPLVWVQFVAKVAGASLWALAIHAIKERRAAVLPGDARPGLARPVAGPALRQP